MKNWQLYKHNLRTGEITKAHESWHDMTEHEADTACSKFTQGPVYRYFAAQVGQY